VDVHSTAAVNRGSDSVLSLLTANDISEHICHICYVMTMETEARTRLNENGRLVIPASFRKALGINPGDEVVLRLEDDELRITTLKHRIARAQRLVRKYVKPGVSLADELIAERHAAARKELE